MIQTLNRFSSESLFDATSHLLHKLHIEFDRETAEPINVADFIDGPMPQYLKDALRCIKNTYFVGVVNDKSLAGAKNADSLDDVAETIQHGGKYDGMFVFACDAKQDANLTRTAATALTRAFNRLASANPVILIIRQNNLLSLSTCERMNYSQEWRQGSAEKLGKVSILRNINCEKPHRGHIDILESLGDKAYATFEDLYKHWMEVFSNELLTKKFYSELSDWYAWAVMVAKFPNDLNTEEDDAKYNHEACIRLITRLIFVWFLKEKHLIPEEFFDETYIRENLIDNFDPHDKRSLYYDAGESKYYRLILQNLFFAMLNCPIVAEGKDTPNNRRFRGDGQKGYLRDGYNVNNLMRYKAEFKEGGSDRFVKIANSHVPFLNGGLFDCLDKKPENLYYDGFSERKESLEQLYLPDWLFFGDEVGRSIDLSQWYDDKKKKNVSARGLIDILKRYCFTIEENTPLDQEVSLDPELLGKVFENLLAAYNPETKQSARKQTGSFYTPREIVQYMVDESLVAHLKRTCGDELEHEYRKLLSYSTEETALNDEQRKAIMQAVYNCRVLDPACGSGAFPMGVLQQLVHVLRQLDPTNEMWKDFMIDLAIEQSKLAFAEDEEEERKARLADIEEAFNKSINDPDYARKLYLIEHCIYGVDIQPIAVQISKLRFFISLVVDQKPTKDATQTFGIRPLPNLESKFVAANTLIPVGYNASLFESAEVILSKKAKLKELNHQVFLAKRNVDKQRLKQEIKETRHALAEAIEDTGFVSQGAAQLLANWDMFDQNASSPFFDAEWMFGVKDGFDIVIGNPPYTQLKKGVYPKTQFPYSEGKDKGKQNLYKLFVEFSYNATLQGGIACMIVQSSLMCDLSATYTRELLLKHTRILQMIEFPKTAPTKEGQVFDSVCQGTCIFILKHEEPEHNYFLLSANNDCTTISALRGEYIFQDILISFYPEDFAIPLLREKEFSILQKIKGNSKKLCDFISDISQGDLNLTVAKNQIKEYDTGINLIRGRHISSYHVNYNTDEFVDKNYRKDYVSRNKRNSYILCQEITGTVDPRRIHCCISDKSKSFLCGHTINKVLLKEESWNLTIMGQLNSKLMDWVFRKTSSNNHVGGYELRQLPIRQPYNKNIEELSEQNLSTPEYDANSRINVKMDIVVYHLYDLIYDEVLVIDPETPISREEYDNFKLN